MRYAIYCRKSKFTGKGNSIDNQEEMCRNYIAANYPNDNNVDIEVFEDEGFSGKNTKRPDFQRMMSSIKKKKFDFLVCYRLDRISRNVGDFSATIEKLRENSVEFICIREHFDTSTSMGKAMLTIAAVFAELERDTIAERIRDNLLMLARSGRWLGGTTPLGFKSSIIKKENIDGKDQISYKLSPVRQEQDIVVQIFRKYLETESLTKVETWFVNQNIRTRKNKYFTPIALREILANPVYCVADVIAYNYFLQHSCMIYNEPNEFTGKYGVSAYNRTANHGKSQKKQPMSEWIIAIGKHKGIIASEDWLKAQHLLEKNKHLSWAYKPQNPVALLSGLIYCKKCGTEMRPFANSNRKSDKGDKPFYYRCELKRKSKQGQCDCKNINGNELDALVCKEILNYHNPSSSIGRKLSALKTKLNETGSESQQQIRQIEKRIRESEEETEQLILSLSKANKDGALFFRIENRMNELEDMIRNLKQELFQLEQSQEDEKDYTLQVETITTALRTFTSTFDSASISDKREFLHSIIGRIEWNEENIHIFLPGESKEAFPERLISE